PSLRLLFLDTDPETAQRATRGADEVALRPSEVLLTRLHRPSHYVKPREGPCGLETWLDRKMLYRIPRQLTAAGIRSLGRLAITFAALTELNYFSSPQSVFSARYELGEVRRTDPLFTCKGPPLQRCQFFALPPGRETAISEENGVPVFSPALVKAMSRAARC